MFSWGSGWGEEKSSKNISSSLPQKSQLVWAVGTSWEETSRVAGLEPRKAPQNLRSENLTRDKVFAGVKTALWATWRWQTASKQKSDSDFHQVAILQGSAQGSCLHYCIRPFIFRQLLYKAWEDKLPLSRSQETQAKEATGRAQARRQGKTSFIIAGFSKKKLFVHYPNRKSSHSNIEQDLPYQLITIITIKKGVCVTQYFLQQHGMNIRLENISDIRFS